MSRTHSNAIVAHPKAQDIHMLWPGKEDFVSSLMLHTEGLDKKDAKTVLRPPQHPAAGAARGTLGLMTPGHKAQGATCQPNHAPNQKSGKRDF